jgi:hypothetical protein
MRNVIPHQESCKEKRAEQNKRTLLFPARTPGPELWQLALLSIVIKQSYCCKEQQRQGQGQQPAAAGGWLRAEQHTERHSGSRML